MKLGRLFVNLLIVILTGFLVASCSGKGEQKEEATVSEADEAAAAAEQTGGVSYVSDEISFGIFFDEDATKRTLKLGRGEKEFDIFIYVFFPDYIEVAAVQWQLELPEGVEIDNDKYNRDRMMSLGQLEFGISERFNPCLTGPKALIHNLTLKVTGDLKNATISILPSKEGDFLGIAKCSEGHPTERASSYKAVVNPDE